MSWRIANTTELIQNVDASLSSFGITRVADVTGLDHLGIPVWASYRPAARTLSTSQGKGLRSDLARLGAIMEAAELWHAEEAWDRPSDAVGGAYRLGVSYPVASLGSERSTMLGDDLELEWFCAEDMQTGKRTFAPRRLVELSMLRNDRKRRDGVALFTVSSNGLASGGVKHDALVHGLLEVIERDTLMRSTRADVRLLDRHIVSRQCPEPLANLLRREDVRVELEAVSGRWGIPCFRARIWCHAFPLFAVGTGCHWSPETAAIRALTEAAQTRVTHIAGARDDIDVDDYAPVVRFGVDLPEERRGSGGFESVQSVSYDLAQLVHHATEVVSFAPFSVQLSDDESAVSVVKVIVPTCLFRLQRVYVSAREDGPGSSRPAATEYEGL